MGELFRTMTMGYGVWTYRDYGDNKLYNPQFALGLRGWKVTGEAISKRGRMEKKRFFLQEAAFPRGCGQSHRQNWPGCPCAFFSGRNSREYGKRPGGEAD